MAMNYTPAKSPVNEFKALCRLTAAKAYRGAPLDCPLQAKLTLVFPRPASVAKRMGIGRMPHTGRPDCDNLAKSVLDALEGIVFRNDALIHSISVEKWKAAVDEQPHAKIEILV